MMESLSAATVSEGLKWMLRLGSWSESAERHKSSIAVRSAKAAYHSFKSSRRICPKMGRIPGAGRGGGSLANISGSTVRMGQKYVRGGRGRYMNELEGERASHVQ